VPYGPVQRRRSSPPGPSTPPPCRNPVAGHGLLLDTSRRLGHPRAILPRGSSGQGWAIESSDRRAGRSRRRMIPDLYVFALTRPRRTKSRAVRIPPASSGGLRVASLNGTSMACPPAVGRPRCGLLDQLRLGPGGPGDRPARRARLRAATNAGSMTRGIIAPRARKGRSDGVGDLAGCGAAQEMEDCWPCGVALRGEAPNHLELRSAEYRGW
jgi:hypothetical protein